MSQRGRRRSSVLTIAQQDMLESRIRNRPTKNTTAYKSVVGTAQEGVAPAIHAAAKKLERNIISDNLNQQLYAREEPDNINALRGDNVAPRLRNAKLALEHAITRDQVGHLLECRPEEDELMKNNVLRSLPNGRRASRIQGVQKQLEHNMTVDKVGHLLEKRSEMEDLQHSNIITSKTSVAPALHKPQRDLQHSLVKSNLYHALKHRPSIVELQERGVYVDRYDDSEGDYDDEYSDDYGYEGQAAEYREDYGDYGDYDQYEEQQYQQEVYEPSGSQRRSKNFHLTRILLKFVASMAEAGEISLAQKGYLKDLIVDQDKTILAVAETFDAENDLNDFKDSLVRLASRR